MPCKQKEKVMRFDVHNDGTGGTGGRHYPAADGLRRGGGADGGSQRFLRYDHRAQHRCADLHGANRRPENAAKIVFTLTIYVLAPPDEPHHRQYGLYAQMITFLSEITALSYQVAVIEFVLLKN